MTAPPSSRPAPLCPRLALPLARPALDQFPWRQNGILSFPHLLPASRPLPPLTARSPFLFPLPACTRQLLWRLTFTIHPSLPFLCCSPLSSLHSTSPHLRPICFSPAPRCTTTVLQPRPLSLDSSVSTPISHTMPSSRQELESGVATDPQHQQMPARATKKRKTSIASAPVAEDPGREAFLARNRMAATKSRQKKREWTHTLEENLRELQQRNKDLKFQVGMLKQDIVTMKSMCLQHFDCNCVNIRSYMNQSLANILTEGQVPVKSPANASDRSGPSASPSSRRRSREASHDSFKMSPLTISSSTFLPQNPVQPTYPQTSSPTLAELGLQKDTPFAQPSSARNDSIAESEVASTNDDLFSIGNHPSSASEYSPMEPAIDPALCDINLLGDAATDLDLKAVWDQFVGDDFDGSRSQIALQA